MSRLVMRGARLLASRRGWRGKHTGSAAMAEGYDYDLIVIGGGSGGLALAKEAASLNRRVALLDHVKPSPRGTTWGLGGTCVNVGCIPKKLMHRAGEVGDIVRADAASYGWTNSGEGQSVSHNWESLASGVQGYIKSLNWGYRVQLRDSKVEYVNAEGRLAGSNEVEWSTNKGDEVKKTAKYIAIAVGGRPSIPDIPGARQLAITSDDLFWLSEPPGKTLVVGASYVGLECAGFLNAFGMDTTVMVRSRPLRGFDTEMSDMVADHMKDEGVAFVKGSPIELKKSNGSVEVKWKTGSEDVHCETFDSVLFASGRTASTSKLGLEIAGVEVAESGKVVGIEGELTTAPSVFALGDVLEGAPELTPVAIQAGRTLARRLFEDESARMDYNLVPTTIFTPLEYSCVGMSEDEAQEKLGEDLEVYHSFYTPLEHVLTPKPNNGSYMKVLCDKSDDERVLGIHICGPNSGEVLQGFATAMRLGLKKADLDDTVGIHPTTAEEMTLLRITKRSGLDPKKTGC